MRLQQPVRIVASAPAELYKGSRCPGPRRLSCNFHTGSGGGGARRCSVFYVVCRLSCVPCRVCVPLFPPHHPAGLPGTGPHRPKPPGEGSRATPSPARIFLGSPPSYIRPIFAVLAPQAGSPRAAPPPGYFGAVLRRSAVSPPLSSPWGGGAGRHSPWELP